MRTAALRGAGADGDRKPTGPGTSTTSAAAAAQDPTINTFRFRRAVERVHQLGLRVIAELLGEAGVPLERVERFADLDRFPPAVLNAVGADRWPPSIFVVRST